MDDPIMNDANDGVGNYDIDDVLDQSQPLEENQQTFLDSAPAVEEPLPSDVYPTQYNEIGFPQHQLPYPHDNPLLFPQGGHHQHYLVVTAPPPVQHQPRHNHLQQEQEQPFCTGQNHRQTGPSHNYHTYPPAPNHAVPYPSLMGKRSDQQPLLQHRPPPTYFHYQQQPLHRHDRQQESPPQRPNQDLLIPHYRANVRGAVTHDNPHMQPDPTTLREVQPLQHPWHHQKEKGAQHIPFPPIAMEPRTWWDTENSTQIEQEAQILPPPPSPPPPDLLPGPSPVQQEQPTVQQHHLQQQQDPPPPPRPRQPRTQPRPATFHPIDEDSLYYAPPVPFPIVANQLHHQEVQQQYPPHHNLPQHRHYNSFIRPLQQITPQEDALPLHQQQNHNHNRSRNYYQPQQFRNEQTTQLQGPPRGLTPIPTQVGELPILNPAAVPRPQWDTTLNNNHDHPSNICRNDNDGVVTNNDTVKGPSPYGTETTTTTTTKTTATTKTRPRKSLTPPSNDRAKKGHSSVTSENNNTHGGNKTTKKTDEGDSAAQHDTYVLRIHDMLEDAESEGHTHIVSWQEHGRAFKIHKPDEFYSTVLPQYFHAKKGSFLRWLRAWGFVKHTEGRDRGAYFHRYFVRGVTTLIKRLSRVQMLEAMENWLEPGELPNFYAMVTLPNRYRQVLKQRRRTERLGEREARKRKLDDDDDGDGDGANPPDSHRRRKLDADGNNEEDEGSPPEEDEDDSHLSDRSSDSGDDDQPEHLKPVENPKRLRGSIIEDVRQMLDDAERENFTHIVSWLPDGTAFKVHNHTAFVAKLMGKYIKTHKFTNFSDVLRSWGFQRLRNEKESTRNAYYHRLFQKDRPKLTRHLSRLQMCEAMADYKKQQVTSSSPPYRLNYDGDDGMIHNGEGVHESLDRFDDEMDENNQIEIHKPTTVPTATSATQASMTVDTNAEMITADMRLYTEDPMNYMDPNDGNKIRNGGDLYFDDIPYQLLPPTGHGDMNTGELADAPERHQNVSAKNRTRKATSVTIIPKNSNLNKHGHPNVDVTDGYELPGSANKSYTAKIHQMLELSEIDGYGQICSWRQHGRAFQIHKEREFQTKILPHFFGAKLPNFYRWLRAWGFLRITSGRDRNCWYHRYFVRGVTDLCTSLNRTEMFDAMQDWVPPGREPNFYSSGKGDIFAEVTSTRSQRRMKDNIQRVRTDDREGKADATAKGPDAAAAKANGHEPDAAVEHVDPRKLRGTVLHELREMLEAAKSDGYEDIVGWQIHGKAFKVRDKQGFAEIMLPRFFNSSKYYYFADTLRSWGFVRLKGGRDNGAFYHKWFDEKKPQMSLHLSRSQMKNAMADFNAGEEPDLYEGVDVSKLGHSKRRRIRHCEKKRAYTSKQKRKVAHTGRPTAPEITPRNEALGPSEAITASCTDSKETESESAAEPSEVHPKSGEVAYTQTTTDPFNEDAADGQPQPIQISLGKKRTEKACIGKALT